MRVKVVLSLVVLLAAACGSSESSLQPQGSEPANLDPADFVAREAEILSVDEQAGVPFGAFDHTVTRKDFTRLEPDLVEHKIYARGAGPVLTVTVSGSSNREELISFRR